MKILLIGKTGQLGSSILTANSGHDIYAPDRRELDIESRQSFQNVVGQFQPDIVINTAAFHDLPQCELEPDRAFAVNCQSVRDMAVICSNNNILFTTFSSDYVFGGEQKTPYSEDDKTRPIQIYGISRLAGEYAALAAAPNHAVVIRTCGLYGLSGATSKGGNFVDKRIADIDSHTKLEMGCDQIVSPTYTYDLAQAVLRLIEHPKLSVGIYHLVNEGECTWYEFTTAIYEFMGKNVTVHPVDRGGMSGKMRRPLYSVLANMRARELGITLPHWRNALHRYLDDKYRTKSSCNVF